MLTFGSYYQSNSHDEVFSKISHPIINKIIDFTLISGSFIMGFVMVAGAGSNIHQQFGLPSWAGALICTMLIVAVAFLNFEKIIKVLGVFTPVIIAIIILVTAYTFIGKKYDFYQLDTVAKTIKPAVSNIWFSVINYYSLCAITAVSMAFVLGGSVVRITAARKGGALGGALIGVIIICAAGYACSFGGFKKLISILYPILGYMGILLLAVLSYAWIREKEGIKIETFIRRKMIRLQLKKYDDNKEFTEKDKHTFRKLGEVSIVDTDSIKSDIKEYSKAVAEKVDDLTAFAETRLSMENAPQILPESQSISS